MKNSESIGINKQSIGMSIFLTIITFGIYGIYWQYLLVKNTRVITQSEHSCVGEMLCLIFVPFYSLYWWFTRGELVRNELSKRGYNPSSKGVVFLLLSIFGWSMVGLGVVAGAIMQHDFNSLPEATDSNHKISIFRMCLLALYIALIVVMDFTPMGYIVMPSGFSITLLIIPVALGAVCTGVSGGAILGFVFGLTSFIQAFGLGFVVDPSAPILFETNPFAYTVICFVPRILVGVIAALIFKAFEKRGKVNILAFILSAASVPLLNTLLFMTGYAVFYKDTILGGKAVMTIVLSAFTFNFLVEFAVTLVAGIFINKIVYTYLKKLKK